MNHHRKLQNVHFSQNTYKYDSKLGLSHIIEIRRLKALHLKDSIGNQIIEEKRLKSLSQTNQLFGRIKYNEPEQHLFNEGERALKFLNNKQSPQSQSKSQKSSSTFPWMLKDPRLCITIKTWIPLLDSIPAILFSYRNPIDVAMSLHKRDKFRVLRGMKMWYVYNRNAILSTNELCRIVSSHEAILTEPLEEITRIYIQLKDKCGMNLKKGMPDKNIVNSFVDVSLNHGSGKNKKDSSFLCSSSGKDKNDPLWWKTLQPNQSLLEHFTDSYSLDVYRECIRAYCSMENGQAFTTNFQWNNDINDA